MIIGVIILAIAGDALIPDVPGAEPTIFHPITVAVKSVFDKGIPSPVQTQTQKPKTAAKATPANADTKKGVPEIKLPVVEGKGIQGFLVGIYTTAQGIGESIGIGPWLVIIGGIVGVILVLLLIKKLLFRG
jgi:hypothetical protein